MHGIRQLYTIDITHQRVRVRVRRILGRVIPVSISTGDLLCLCRQGR